MFRRKTIKLSIVVVVIFMATWLFITYMDSNVEYYHIFEDQPGLFDAVKDEVDGIERSKLGYQSNNGDIFLYKNGGNAAPDLFHPEVSTNLQGKIQQINELSGDKLSQIRYVESDGRRLISFVFDWERAYGDTYHIVYCKSQDEIGKSFDENVIYDLKQLDGDWYGTRIR
jgi:hypothetical protein